jgi:short-subunit dehydrogenase
MARISQPRRRSGAFVLAGLAAAVLARSVLRAARRIDLEGRVVIVTGGSRGLGLLLAEEFGRRGARVAICGRNREALEVAEKRLTRMGIEVLARPADLGDPRQAELFVERVSLEWGRIDVLVNNAGAIHVEAAQTTSLEHLDEEMRSNFWSAANTTMAAIPHLAEQGGDARIVNVVSIGGRVAIPHLLGYSASKFALMGFSEGLAAELSRSKIKVVTVVPGLMRTGSFYNAEFAGKQRREFEWFSLFAALPLTSVSAHRAARRIARATEYAEREVVIGLPAMLLSLLHGLAPRLTLRLMTGVNRLLPPPAEASGDTFRGREVGSPLQPLLKLGNLAAAENNEAPPSQATR